MDLVYPYMREILGIPTAGPVEAGVRRRVEGYRNAAGFSEVNPAAFTGAPIEGKWISPWAMAHRILTLCDDHAHTGDATLLVEARHILDFWTGLATESDNHLYMASGPVPWKDGKWLDDVGWCVYYAQHYAFVLEPLVRYFEESGDEKVLALAVRFAESVLDGAQPSQGDTAVDPQTGAFQGHVHLHTRTVWGMAHLGFVTGDVRYSLWAKRASDFVLAKGTDFGWYPEFIPQQEYRSETCVVGDLCATGYWLAKAGWIEEYDRLERTFRNYLRTVRFYVDAPFEALFRRVHADRSEGEILEALGRLKEIEGGFGAQVAFNDLVTFPETLGTAGMAENGIQMMGCCPPSGMLALHYVWRALSDRRGDVVSIHMALDGDTKQARIRCSSDAGPRLRVEAFEAGDYRLRVPCWARKADVKVRHAGRAVPVRWAGPGAAYVEVTGVVPGDVLELDYALPSFRQTFRPDSVPGGTGEVRVHWLGNQVLSIDPAGEFLPIYPAGG
jgi:hypothetical protein